jgi:endoglucanase
MANPRIFTGLVLLGIGGITAIGIQSDPSTFGRALGKGPERPPIAPAKLTAYAVQSDILAIHRETGQVDYGTQGVYGPRPGDRLTLKGDPKGNPETWVLRQGKPIGNLVGPGLKTLYSVDRFRDRPLDLGLADNATSYRIQSLDQPTVTVEPTQVFRKSKPRDMARLGPWDFGWPMAHTLYLKLPKALVPGRYQIDAPGLAPGLGPIDWTYAPDRSPSEAVHVSQIGFRPDDSAKVGFLSTWMGTGGGVSYGALDFQVIDDRSQAVVLRGKSKLGRSAEEPEEPRKGNHSQANVYRLDFSALAQAGRYRLCVATIGCSRSFEIGADTWGKAFRVAAKGFYVRRSGIAIRPPYGEPRPRSFHPADGVKVYQTEASLLETGNGLGTASSDLFADLIDRQTETIVPDAWGGYFDAGDWDRRIQHLDIARSLLELAELAPDYIAQTTLNIPESGNSRPDVIDEALWGLDFFRRLQQADGGIRGGIEMTEHPLHGETSWTNSLTPMVYAADPWSSYLYAGVAAQAATVLGTKEPALAATYRASALRAMAYGEKALVSKTDRQGKPWPPEVRDARNLAAVELYRLTRDPQWHKLFLATTVFRDPKAELFNWQHHEQRNAAFGYGRLGTDIPIDAQLQRQVRAAIEREAEQAIAIGQKTGFHWTRQEPYSPIIAGGGFGNPKVTTLIRAHVLTGNPRYLKAAILGCQVGAGANPENMTYTTGVGQRSPQHPLLIDERILGRSTVPGVTVYGPTDVHQFDDWPLGLIAPVTTPPPRQWPTLEAYFDIYNFPLQTELTVMETMAPTAYAWGYLAARSGADRADRPRP